MRKVLITGGLGYLGAKISSMLVKAGMKVRIATSRENPSVPKELLGCDLVKINLLDIDTLIAACDNVDTIIHLAAANYLECEADQEYALKINGLGTLNLLNAAQTCSVRSFVYFSTIHVYFWSID
jgi:UDP-glucose 4-epimerase